MKRLFGLVALAIVAVMPLATHVETALRAVPHPLASI